MAREHLQILLIEDNHADVKLIRELFAEVEEIDIDMDSVSRLSLGLGRYAGGGVDVVLLDLTLPDSQGLDTLRTVHSQLPDASIVVLTAPDPGKLALAALQEGAQDYLVKSHLDSVGLIRSMRYAIERRRAERRRDLASQILATLNRDNQITQLVRDILHLIKEETGSEAVGLRLREGDDFPYYESSGFPESFVEAERRLCERDASGEVVRDAHGNPVLACMCGNVLCGRTDPNLPFFTAKGSFWTNSTTELLASTTEEQRQGRMRNRCNSAGYESLALVPLRSGGRIIGLLQLNDHRKGMFTLDRIRFFEEIGASIGIALARQQAAKALHDSEVRYRRVFEAAKDGILILNAETGMVMDANPFLLERLGFSRDQVFGKKVWELGFLKDILASQASFLKLQREGYVRYENLPLKAADGGRVDVEFISNVYEAGHHKVIQCDIRDITERKRTAEALRQIEWMLINGPRAQSSTQNQAEPVTPAYGDLVELNTCRVILDAVGEKALADIVRDCLDLLETSAAVFEKDGGYALSTFSSGWCRFMDHASRRLCGTADNREALAGGKWLCHESCWTQASKMAIDKEGPADVECQGGIHLFAVPIRAGGEILGAISIGYGDPPSEPAKLRDLAVKFGVTVEELVEQSAAYLSRPSFIIELAKRRLGTSARLIGEMVERKRTEKALRDSEAKYRALSEACADGILIADLETKVFLYANPAASRMLGYSREELRTMGVADIHPKEDMPRVTVEFEAQARGEKTLAADLPCLRKDGTILYADVNAATAVIDGRTCLLGFFRDITERRRAGEALRESEERFRGLFESSRDAIMTLEPPSWRFTSCNPATVKIFGAKNEEEFVAHGPWELSPERQQDGRASAEKAKEMIEMAVREGSLFFEWTHRRIGGEEFFADVLLTRMERGGKTILQATVRDITDRKRAETYREMGGEILQILNESRDLPESFQRVLVALKTRTGFDAVGIRLQEGDDFPYFVQQGFPKDFLLTENTLIEHASDGSVCLDKEGKISLECACGLVISGKTDPANPLFTPGGSCWTNNSFPLLDIPPDQDPRRHPRNECIHQGYASLALVPIRNKERVVGLVQFNDRRKGCFTLDVVRILEGIAAHIGAALMRKRAEDERAKIEDQLRQAHKMESIGRLAGGVAHDFNNILTGIGGYTELVLDRLDTASPLREDLGEVQRLAKRAADLTQQLLAFSRRQPLEPRILNLNDTVADTSKMLKRVIGEDIDFQFAPAPDLGNVRADPGQIEQILMNLAVNSRDAMPTGGKLTIETANIELDAEYAGRHVAVAPGPYVMLAVSDTGCGMDAATKERLFEPFFTTKEKGKGTGLGLATVYGIVKQHGGNIWVYSEPGKGATLKIYLPRVAEAVSNVGPAVEPETARGEEMILVVEDEAPVYAFAERVLKARGYAVVIARSAEEAQRVFSVQEKTVSLLLTDVVLPGMNGRVLYDLLKSKKPDLKVLYMSGYTDNAIVHQGVLDAGITFIQKPFTTEMLARKVRQVLDS